MRLFEFDKFSPVVQGHYLDRAVEESKNSIVVEEDERREIVHVTGSSQNFADGMRDYWRHWLRFHLL